MLYLLVCAIAQGTGNLLVCKLPGGGLGFDREGHWVGQTQGAAEMARLLRLERER